MTRRLPFVAVVLGVCVLTAPIAAQSRPEQQVLLDIRLLQSQVQRLQLAVNAVTEELKRTDGRLDTQSDASLKGFADQKLQIDALAAGLRTLNERENEGSVRVLQLTQEMKSVRKGLEQQQTTLDAILKILQQSPTATPTDPMTPGLPGGAGAPPALPPSPGEYYKAAFDFFGRGAYEGAIQTLQDAIAKFPDYPEAARAQVTIGDAHVMLRQEKEALAAFGTAIKTYKDPEAVSDAYYKEGLAYERLGQKDLARKSLDELRKLYPNSTAALLAINALKRMGFIK